MSKRITYQAQIAFEWLADIPRTPVSRDGKRRPRGEAHPNSLLTAEIVQEIRRSYPSETYQQIADRFGIRRRTVTDLVRGKSWTWLPHPEPSPPILITCRDCGASVPVTNTRRLTERCEPCGRSHTKAQARLNQIRRGPTEPDMDRNYRMKHFFGISLAIRDQFVVIQGGRCAICRTDEADCSKGRLVVDHDHATGTLRGMLCTRCNFMLGACLDNPDILRAAIYYLELSNEPTEDLYHDPPDDCALEIRRATPAEMGA